MAARNFSKSRFALWTQIWRYPNWIYIAYMAYSVCMLTLCLLSREHIRIVPYRGVCCWYVQKRHKKQSANVVFSLLSLHKCGISIQNWENGADHFVILEVYFGNNIKRKINNYQKKIQLIMELEEVALYRQNYLT